MRGFLKFISEKKQKKSLLFNAAILFIVLQFIFSNGFFERFSIFGWKLI